MIMTGASTQDRVVGDGGQDAKDAYHIPDVGQAQGADQLIEVDVGVKDGAPHPVDDQGAHGETEDGKDRAHDGADQPAGQISRMQQTRAG